MGSSPHTRGALAVAPADDREPGIIPAYAGSTSLWRSTAWDARDHPRIRGEHSAEALDEPHVTGSSPHTRGALRHALRPHRHEGIIPAYAGSTPEFVYEERHEEGIIPAYAGSTIAKDLARIFQWDHPRIRGEHNKTTSDLRKLLGSSPHTRGALNDRICRPARLGIIPAYAGSTSRARRRTTSAGDHPRIRGEHERSRMLPLGHEGSSPHTRGALYGREGS